MLAIFCSTTCFHSFDAWSLLEPQEHDGLRYRTLAYGDGYDCKIYAEVIAYQDVLVGEREQSAYERLKSDILGGAIDEVWAAGPWSLYRYGRTETRSFKALCRLKTVRVHFQSQLERDLRRGIERIGGRKVYANHMVLSRIERLLYKRRLVKEDYEAIAKTLCDATEMPIHVDPNWTSVVRQVDEWLSKHSKGYQGDVIKCWATMLGSASL